MRNDTGHPLIVSSFAQRTQFPPKGMRGGKPGSLRRHVLKDQPVHATRRYALNPGDSLTATEAGGGGFGDPVKRPPETVLQDVLDGFVTVAGARRDYGVTVDPVSKEARR